MTHVVRPPRAERGGRLLIGVLLGLMWAFVPVSSVAAQSVDTGTPSAPSQDQVSAEQAARAAQPSPAPGPVTTAEVSTSAGGTGGGGGDSGCFLGICDPGSWLKDQVNGIVSSFLKDLVSDATSAVSSFFESLNFITRTPKELSYQEDYVREV